MSDYDDSEEEQVFVPSIVRRFGQDSLIDREPSIVGDLLRQGSRPTPAAVLAAAYRCEVEVLRLLLDGGGDANARQQIACLDDQTTQYDDFERNQNVTADTREWYAIQFAAQHPDSESLRRTAVQIAESKDRRRQTMQLLMSYGADLYKTYKQPLWPSIPGPFPGEGITFVDHYEWDQALPEGQGVWDGAHSEEPHQRNPIPHAGHIPRCILHSLFEDGGYIVPLLDHIDLEHRDPLGRTILQSACRSTIGADAAIELTVQDMLVDSHKLCFSVRPVPDSIFASLVSRGADLTAFDHSGRNVVHHLLEARAQDPCELPRIPLIRNSLKSVIVSHPHLIHQANHHGLTPQFCALQRLRACSTIQVHFTKEVERVEDVVNDLLDAGVDPLALDVRGNTALHYIVECGVLQVDDAESVRLLMARYLNAGVDVNAPNLQGKTALESLFTINERFEDLRELFESLGHRSEDWLNRRSQIEDEVFAMLDAAGADWLIKTANQQTLLHLLARTDMDRPTRRAAYLISKGVDLFARDSSGQTAEEVAKEVDNKRFLTFVANHKLTLKDTM